MIVGIAGLGVRGRAIGARLRATGRRVIGFDADVTAAAGSSLRTAGTLERLARECETVLVAVDGDPAETLVQDLAARGGILTTIALCGALEPRRVRDLAAAAGAVGMSLLDVPLDGGEEAIRAGQAVVFAAGSQAAVSDGRALLQALGSVVYVGEAGSGQIARTVNDLLRWASLLAIHEAFGLARAAGASPSPIREAVLSGGGASRVLQDWGAAGLLPDQVDVEAALLLARETGAAMPFLEQLPGLLDRIDSGQAPGFFNLGIADLSPRDPAPEAAPEVVDGFD